MSNLLKKSIEKSLMTQKELEQIFDEETDVPDATDLKMGLGTGLSAAKFGSYAGAAASKL